LVSSILVLQIPCNSIHALARVAIRLRNMPLYTLTTHMILQRKKICSHTPQNATFEEPTNTQMMRCPETKFQSEIVRKDAQSIEYSVAMILMEPSFRRLIMHPFVYPFIAKPYSSSHPLVMVVKPIVPSISVAVVVMVIVVMLGSIILNRLLHLDFILLKFYLEILCNGLLLLFGLVGV
jgi:hypothetical protein